MAKRNIWLRRVSQTVFWGLWIFLFWQTACRKMAAGRPALTLNSTGVGEPAVLVVDPTPKLPGKAQEPQAE